jgi:hypothetical protein
MTLPKFVPGFDLARLRPAKRARLSISAGINIKNANGFRMNLRVFHCGISFSTHNPLTGSKERDHVSGFILAQDPDHCKAIAQQNWTKGKLEWCDENTWEQTKDTNQKWLNVRL